MRDLVSVVIPTYNREKTIIRTIESALNQTYSPMEILVCDDFSTDRTREIVEQIAKEHQQIRIISREDGKKGANAARSLGVQSACGKYIAFMDSDDVFTEDSILNRVNVFNQYPDVDMVYGDVLVGGKKVSYDKMQDTDQHKYLMEELSLCCFSVIMVKREIFHEVSLPDMNLKSWQDDAIVLSIDEAGKKLFHCENIVAEMGAGEGRITANYKNLYEGIRCIVKRYRKNIAREKSVFRVVLWRIRVWRNYFQFKWRLDEEGKLAWFHHIMFLICDDICVHNFRHIWG